MSAVLGTKAGYLVLLVLCAVLFFGNLGAAYLWDIDETNNAEAALEMLQQGDLVVPTVNGVLRTDKPPLHYWFMMVSYRLFGVNEFAARFFAAVFGTLTVLMTAAAGRAAWGPAGGLAAGSVLATSLLFSFSSRSATTDAFLVFFFSAAVLCLWRASRGQGRRWALAGWAAMGFAVLAKGPVGVVLPLGILVLAAMLPGGDRWAGLRRLLFPPGILLFLAVALPWYLLAAERTGGSLVSGFLLRHNVGRFLSPMQSHRGPVIYYLPILLLGFAPWVLLLPQSLAASLRGRGGGRETGEAGRAFGILLVVWASVVVAFFSLAGTKLPTYTLPAFPALALMTGALAARLAAGERPRGMSLSWALALLPAAALPAALYLALSMHLPSYAPYAMETGAVLAGVLAALWAQIRGRPLAALGAAAAGAALNILLLHQVVAPALQPLRTDPILARVAAAYSQPGDELAAYGYYHFSFRASLPFYAGRRVERLATPEELGDFLSRPGGRFVVMGMEDFTALPRGLRAVLFPMQGGYDYQVPRKPLIILAARVRPYRPGSAGGLPGEGEAR